MHFMCVSVYLYVYRYLIIYSMIKCCLMPFSPWLMAVRAHWLEKFWLVSLMNMTKFKQYLSPNCPVMLTLMQSSSTVFWLIVFVKLNIILVIKIHARLHYDKYFMYFKLCMCTCIMHCTRYQIDLFLQLWVISKRCYIFTMW